MSPRLERYLSATRPGFDRIEPDADSLAGLAAFAAGHLPEIGPIPRLHVIASRARRWEYLAPHDSCPDGILIIDRALEDALLDLQHLMMVRHDGGPALAWMLSADACRHERAERAYLLFASAALDFGDKIASLAALRVRREDAVTQRFLLLHELGHVAIARAVPWTVTVREVVDASRQTFIDHVTRRLTAPNRTPDGYVHGVGTPFEETPVEMLVANFGRYIEVGTADAGLVDELCCDWIAALGLAGMRGAGFPDSDGRPEPGSWRRAADGLFLATRLVRLLGFLVGLRHQARSLAARAEPYWAERYQVELSIRLNVIANLAMTYNAEVLARLSFAEGSGFPEEASREAIIAAFDGAIIRDGRLFHDRIFRLYDIIEPVRDPDRLAADLDQSAATRAIDDPMRVADALRAALDDALRSRGIG